MTVQLPANAEVPRDHRGRFGPGNPGRKPGSRNRNALGTLSALGELSSKAIAVLSRKLDSGDLRAAAIVLKHVLPEGRPIELPSSDPNAWADAMAEGLISPEEASKAATALGKLKDVAEISDLRCRLDELEALLLAKGQP